MKVLGVRNSKYFIASAGRHDYNAIDDLMVDGGQPGCTDYAGYNRHRGATCWAEIPITFGEFYTDYQMSTSRERQYGVWMFKPLVGECQVRILPDEEIPDTNSLEWKLSNAVWGTRGKDGKQPVKFIHLIDAEEDHLNAILDLISEKHEYYPIIKEILKRREV